MDNSQIIFLAILQGLTEFLPISSSAHLILLPKFFNWPDQGLVFDIAVHLGSLFAVISYFWQPLKQLFADFLSSIIKRQHIGQSKTAWGLLLATIPVGLVGLFFKDIIETELRSAVIIAYATLLFALLLGIADYLSRHYRHYKAELTWKIMLLTGFFQTLALIPGTSRSGITLTAVLLLGVSRTLGAQFIFLLSIPVIILSALLAMLDLLTGQVAINYLQLILAFLASAISAYAVVALFMRFIEKMRLTPFVIYRILLALLILQFYG